MRKLFLASTAASLLAAGAAFAQPATMAAAPGTVSTSLGGYFQYGYGAYSASGQRTAADGSYRLTNNGSFGDFRLLPAVNGQTLNNIWYGFQGELRTSLFDATKAGKNNNSAVAAGKAGQGEGSIYVQRAYGYIGMPQYGFARFGQTDSAFTLSQTGVIEAFGDGAQFNCDGGACQISPTSLNPMIFSDSAALYSTNKFVYESPKFETGYGNFSGMVGFEPNSNGVKEGYANTQSSLGANVDSVSGSSVYRRRNTVDVSATYENEIDGFANKFSASYLHGSPIHSTDGTYTDAYLTTGTPTGTLRGFSQLSVYQFGAQTTYAGLTVGANIKGGRVNDSYTFAPKGTRNAFGYIIGAAYNVGPYTIGANYFNTQSAGQYTPGAAMSRTENQYGVAVGGNYQLAKPISLFVEYEHGGKHQLGANMGNGKYNNIKVNIFAAGATIKW